MVKIMRLCDCCGDRHASVIKHFGYDAETGYDDVSEMCMACYSGLEWEDDLEEEPEGFWEAEHELV
jgi:hypothetical protein